MVVLRVWWPLGSFLPPADRCTAVGKAVVGQGVALLVYLKERSFEKELYAFVGERFTEQMSSWKCCSLCGLCRALWVEEGITHFLCM